MSQENLKKIKKLLVGMAEYYGEAMNETRVQVCASVLEDLDAEAVGRTIAELMRDPAITRFPLPAVIRDRIEPTLSLEQAAQELLTRAITAVGGFGYYQSERAKDYLGPTLWRAIGGINGWEDWCVSTDIAVNRAHLRERIKGLLAQEFPSGRVKLPAPGKGNKLALPKPPQDTRKTTMLPASSALKELFEKLDALTAMKDEVPVE